MLHAFQPITGIDRPPRGEADYEFVLFGGNRPENSVGYELRRWMPMDLFPALRDAESDLARWTRSPLRPLLDRAAQTIDEEELKEIAEKGMALGVGEEEMIGVIRLCYKEGNND